MQDFINSLKNIFILILLLLLAFILAIFILQNLQEARVYFDLFKSQNVPFMIVPVWALVFANIGIGAVIGMVIMWFYEGELRDNFAKSQDEQKKLEKDMNNLKSNISKSLS